MSARGRARNTTPSRAPANLSRFLNAKEGEEKEDGDDDDRDCLQESNLSPWSPAKKCEQKVLYPPTEDEQIVNAAPLNFLTVVTIAHPGVCLRWCLSRKVLQFACNTENGGPVGYQARTDGYLRGVDHSTAYKIVEVKPYIRANRPDTRWQETAQMAAWIREDSFAESVNPAKLR
jgi:hypothetical protein